MRTPFAIVRWLLPALLLASAAAAQEPPPRDPVDDTAVRIGKFGFTPVISLHDVGRDNNVFNESVDPKSDFTATISPKLDILTHPGPLLLTVTTYSDYVYYQTYKTERGSNIGSSVRADFTFGPVKPYLSASGANVKDRLNREIDTRARHNDRAYNAGVRVQIYEGLFASAEARRTTRVFDDNATFRGENLAVALDGETNAVDGAVGVAITPLTSVSVVVTEERDRFDFSPERDADSVRIMPTVTFSPLAMLNGTASFGYRRFNFLDPVVPDYRGFVASMTLGATVHEKHRIETGFARDVQYSYEQDSIYYIETGIQGSWTWQMTTPFDVRIMGSRSRLHYQARDLTAADDEDVAFGYGGGVGWRLRDSLRIGINADWRERNSERGADRGYDNRKIFASVTWGKQQ